MTFRTWSLFLSVIGFLAFSNTAFAVISSTSAEFFDSTTEGTSSTTKSTKKIFGADNDTQRLKNFVNRNFDRLQEEAARGNGTFLADYVNLVGCEKSQGVVIEAMQKNYQQLFNNGKVELINQTKQLIHNRSDLNAACEIRS